MSERAAPEMNEQRLIRDQHAQTQPDQGWSGWRRDANGLSDGEPREEQEGEYQEIKKICTCPSICRGIAKRSLACLPVCHVDTSLIQESSDSDRCAIVYQGSAAVRSPSYMCNRSRAGRPLNRSPRSPYGCRL